ncbi:hypothetical protein O6H91_06G085300 [Diphasiastrum complanatum]|uniref:Uncharacterized protein n=2 Tax=Diphasiastrum complanatum TaxID=34168 RepID=A0ACC2DFU5_DIPCM|nr:hypothetical protein O6H91_06G085300 [Diphasiastrum complanatum]KAJ7553142.1 hypothetical protein O6H91_06G085300 [Diphasiastrum complanatum]
MPSCTITDWLLLWNGGFFIMIMMLVHANIDSDASSGGLLKDDRLSLSKFELEDSLNKVSESTTSEVQRLRSTMASISIKEQISVWLHRNSPSTFYTTDSSTASNPFPMSSFVSSVLSLQPPAMPSTSQSAGASQPATSPQQNKPPTVVPQASPGPSPSLNMPHSSTPQLSHTISPSPSDKPPSASESISMAPSESPSPLGCCSGSMMPRPGSIGENCSCVYPIQLGLLLENVSLDFINSSEDFQHELSSQLMLSESQVLITAFQFLTTSELNMSIDIGPLTGESFSSQQAEAIRTEFETYKVQFNSSLVGNYSLISFQRSEPLAPSPGDMFPPKAQASAPASFQVLAPQKSLELVNKRSNLGLGVILGIVSGVMVVLCIVAILFCKCVTRSKPAEKLVDHQRKDSGQPIPCPTNIKNFFYDELKEATNNFDSANILGEGGFGRVYKGVLKDGTPVAIKKLTSGGHQGDREFLVEVQMLSRLHHRHLVKLVGYFSSRDCLQQLLCYELVPHGSLESWLHGRLGATTPLDWDTRMKIAIGAARGLAYLHEDSQPCVIHRDFKASNILLENDFNPKVADFGLAKQAPEGQRNYVATRVMGTFGYVAPEYAMTGHLLVKSDVYSYGVVLLELLSGRRPVDMSRPSGQENLVTWARPVLKDRARLDELVDPKLNGLYNREDFLQVAAIAAACVAPEASQRPTMGEVVQSLKMVQRVSEYPVFGERDHSMVCSPTASISNQSFTASWQHTLPTSTTFESDGSSVFSSGPVICSLNIENSTKNPVISEDLMEGR